MSGSRRTPPLLLATVSVVLVWSAVRPNAYGTWLMETIWAVAGVIVVVVAWRQFPLTTLLCCLLALWATVLAYGGHYGYANTPAGDAVQSWLELERNPYDRLGHFLQGFVPAIAVREVLWRRSPLQHSAWLPPLTVCVCLAFSAGWELLEWAGALAVEGGDPVFLGGQGDPWDTQWDLLLALLGSLLALTAMTRLHDGQLAERVAPQRADCDSSENTRAT